MFVYYEDGKRKRYSMKKAFRFFYKQVGNGENANPDQRGGKIDGFGPVQ